MSFLDQARKLLTNFGQGVFNATPIGQTYNATKTIIPKKQQFVSPLPNRKPALQNNYSLMQNFARSPIAKGIGNFQTNIEQRTLPKVNLSQYTQNIQAPVARFVAGMGAGITENLINTPQRLLEGGGRIGLLGRQQHEGQYVSPQKKIGAYASVASPMLDILTLGGGAIVKKTGENIVKQLGKQTIGQAAKQGSLQGVKWGALFGGLGGLSEGEEAQFGNFIKGLAGGAVVGGAVGGVTGGVSGVISLLKRPPEAKIELAKLRDAQPRLKNGEYTYNELVKPKTLTKPQWEFQLKFNKKYKRNPYEPVYPSDLKKAITYEVEKKGVGLSIRDISKDKNPLGSSQPIGGGGGATTKVPLSNQTQLPAQKPQLQIPPKSVAGQVDGGIPKSSSSSPIILQLGKGNPIQRIIEALKVAKPLNQKQKDIYHQIKSQQAGALSGIGEGMKGEQGYYQKLGKLKGELPKVEFESIRKQLSQDDINEVFNMVEKSNLGVFEKVNAQTALGKLLGAEGGSVPTKSEIALLNEIFPPEFIKAVMEKRPFTQKLFGMIENGLNLPRAVMATADFSAPLRQGIFLIGRPKQWVPAFKNMFKYAFSEKAYKNFGDDIKARPNYKLYREAKLSITDTNPLPGSREETFMSNLADKIPGFGRISKGSNRAYSGFLNKLRVDTFDDLVKSAQQQGQKEEGKLLEDIGNFVNSATGRGLLPKFISKSAPLLNATFFSPRLMASRMNLLNPVYYAKLDPFVRKEALKSLVTFGGTAMTVLGLAKLGGAEVGVDPRNADFGKIKVGNTRYDVLGGFQQYIRLAAQLTTGQIVSSTTGKIITLGEGYKPLTKKDILMRFFENKESPVASFVTGLIQGTNSMGDKFNPSQEVINRFIPMMAQDIYDLNKEWGAKGTLMALPGLFGAGSQTYGKQELVSGKNQLGEDTTALQAPKGLSETINDKIFGKPVLGTTPQYSADAYYKQLLKLPKEEAAAKYDEIRKSNPELAKKIVLAHKDYQLGVTPNDETLRMKGVASGDRAMAVSKELNKLKTPQEKATLWDEYVKKKIITKEVAKQLKALLK